MSNNEFGENSPNPYQAASPTFSLPSGTKPAAITVFGILNIVFGIMGLCGVLGFAIQTMVLENQGQIDNPILEMTNTPIYFGFTVVQTGLGFLASIILLTSGIGLLNGKPYGRTLAIIWAIFQLIASVVGIVFTAIFLMMPLMERAETMADGPEKMGLIFGGIGATAGGLCGMIYPIVLLIFMMRASVVNFMRSQRLG
ncbi:MAG: hypothetical protein ACTHOU_13075 [Aureliella sp.]